MIENNNIRFFVIDDLHGKRQELMKIVSEIAPDAELQSFEHPIYLKRWLELQREAGKELSQKPTFVISDHDMGRVQPPLTEIERINKYQITSKDLWNQLQRNGENYHNIEGSLKVLQEFANYLGKVFVIGVSGGLRQDAVLEKINLELPSKREELSQFAHNTSDRSKTQFDATKAQSELDKFKTLLA